MKDRNRSQGNVWPFLGCVAALFLWLWDDWAYGLAMTVAIQGLLELVEILDRFLSRKEKQL